MSKALVNHLKILNQDRMFPMFHEALNNIFGDQVEKRSFVSCFQLNWKLDPQNVPSMLPSAGFDI